MCHSCAPVFQGSRAAAKIYGNRTPRVHTDTFTSSLNCGIGFHTYENGDAEVDLRLVFDQHGNQVPAMPPDLFAFDLVCELQNEVSRLDRAGTLLYGVSLCSKYKINVIPLKPVPPEGSEPALEALLRESKDGLRNFHSKNILQHNPAANLGFLRVLRHLANEWGVVSERNDRYKMLCVDADIYMKCLKVPSI